MMAQGLQPLAVTLATHGHSVCSPLFPGSTSPSKVGLMYRSIGGYGPEHLCFVAGFDVDARKVRRPLGEALRAPPNCAMDHVGEISLMAVEPDAVVYEGPVLDGIAPHMSQYDPSVTFVPSPEPQALSQEEVEAVLRETQTAVVINYLPVGSHVASRFYIEAAINAGCHVVNCIPTYISTEEARRLEQKFIDRGLTLVGSDMRSAWGASRLSEVLQGALLDAGCMVTQHIQCNMAAGATQGTEHVRNGVTANTGK